MLLALSAAPTRRNQCVSTTGLPQMRTICPDEYPGQQTTSGHTVQASELRQGNVCSV